MGWLTSAPSGVVVRTRYGSETRLLGTYVNGQLVNQQLQRRTVTVTVTEYRAMTKTCAEALAETWRVVATVVDCNVERQNESGAYRVVVTTDERGDWANV